MTKREKKTKKALKAQAGILALVFIIGCGIYYRFVPRVPDGEAYFYFFDVGQGDAAAVVTRRGCILIDAGTNASEDTLRMQLIRAGIDRIDIAIFTHPHEDHIGGADMVLTEFEVDEVIMPERGSSTKTFSQLSEAIEASGARLCYAEPGDTREVDGMRLTILFADDETVDENDMSAVVMIEYGDTSAIYTGDAGTGAEKMILDGYPRELLACDILKVGHHGSSTSSSAEWLGALSPRFGVISCGEGNDYGHPHAAVLSRLKSVGATVMRTDLEGKILLVSDGSIVSPAEIGIVDKIFSALPLAG